MLEPSLIAIQLSVPPGTLPLVLVAAGLGLGVLEALAPGAHFIVLGVALLAAGLVGLVLGPVASPIVLSVLVLVFGALALYGYREFDVYGGKGSGRTSDSTSLRGRTGRVTERVTPTEGEVKLDKGGFNPRYAARSVDGEIAEGTEVIVVDPGGGNVVTVESMSGAYDDIDRKLERGRTVADSGDGGNADAADAPKDADAADAGGRRRTPRLQTPRRTPRRTSRPRPNGPEPGGERNARPCRSRRSVRRRMTVTRRPVLRSYLHDSRRLWSR